MECKYNAFALRSAWNAVLILPEWNVNTETLAIGCPVVSVLILPEWNVNIVSIIEVNATHSF